MCNDKLTEIMFDDALHASKLFHNLILLRCLVKKGVRVDMEGNSVAMCTPGGEQYLSSNLHTPLLPCL